MDSEKSISPLEMKKEWLPDHLVNNYIFYQFLNNFPALLFGKINFFNIFDMSDFFRFLRYRKVLKF